MLAEHEEEGKNRGKGNKVCTNWGEERRGDSRRLTKVCVCVLRSRPVRYSDQHANPFEIR